MCFKYAVAVGLNHKKIKKDLQRISKFTPYINKYKRKELSFPTGSIDWIKFETNNKAIALNVLFSPHKSEQIKQVYISKHNSERENQLICLKITEGKK